MKKGKREKGFLEKHSQVFAVKSLVATGSSVVLVVQICLVVAFQEVAPGLLLPWVYQMAKGT